MGFHFKLLGFWTLFLSALVVCHSHQVTVNVVGTLNCRDCIKQQLTTDHQHSGLHVTVHCDFQSRETKTHGSSSVDKQGNFNITLSAKIINEDKYRCYAMLQSTLTTQCPLRKAMKILNTATQTKRIVFSPLTCQSAFFWPFFKFPPKPEFMFPPFTYTPPEQLTFPPTPGTEYGNTFPLSPQQAPIPKFQTTSPPPVYETPSPFSPTPGTEYGNTFPPSPQRTPTPKFQTTNPPPVYETPSPPIHYREPNPIPRPPPVPLLPKSRS